MIKFKIFFLLLLIIPVNPLYSQFAITKPAIDFSSVHYIKKLSISDQDSALQILANNKGEGKIWDFTGLSPDTSSLPRKTEYINGNALKGVGDFENVSLIISESYADTIKFSMYVLNDSSLQAVGELSNKKDSNTVMDLVYDPPLISAVFPLSYGIKRNFSSTVNFAEFNMALNFELEVDGWGELITTAGRSKVLRIKLGGKGKFIENDITVNNYLFVNQNNILIPLAEIQEIIYSGVGTYSASFKILN